MMKQKSFSGKGKKSVPTTPEPRSGHVLLASATDGTVYVVGGHAHRGPQTDVWSYKPNEEQWTLLSNAEMNNQSPLPRFEFDACLVGPFIYLFGGFQSDEKDVSILNDLWVFDLEYQTWNLISEECSARERSGHVVVAIDAERFIVHGGTCMGSLDDFWVYDTSSGHWEEIIALEPPCARSMHSAVFCESSKTLAIFGGVTHHGSEAGGDLSPVYLNDLWVVHLTDNIKEWTWNMVTYDGFAPSPRDMPALVAVGSGVILFGGFGFVEISDDLSDDEQDQDDLSAEKTSEIKDDGVSKTNRKASRSNEFDHTQGNRSKEGKGQSPRDSRRDSRDGRRDSRGLSPKEGKGGLTKDGREPTALERQASLDGKGMGKPFPRDLKETASKDSGVSFDEDEDDDSMLAIDYLSDAWYVNLDSGKSTEIDFCSLSTFQDDSTEEEGGVISCIPRRGCKLISANNGKIISFGGYDGENFYGKTEELNVDILASILSAKS
jgi:Galactose oxidase, central domain/Kelch motif